jgi:hypothetical protein
MPASKTSKKPTGKRHGFEYSKQDRNQFTHRKGLGETSARLSYVVGGHRFFVMTNSFSTRTAASAFAKKHKGVRTNMHTTIIHKVGADGKDHYLIGVRYTKYRGGY